MDDIDDALAVEAEDSGGGKLKWLLFLLAAVAGVMAALKKKREQELDEALWEEPRAL